MRGSRGGNSVVDRVKGKGPNKYKQLRTNLMRKKQSRGGIGVSPLNRVNSNQNRGASNLGQNRGASNLGQIKSQALSALRQAKLTLAKISAREKRDNIVNQRRGIQMDSQNPRRGRGGGSPDSSPQWTTAASSQSVWRTHGSKPITHGSKIGPELTETTLVHKISEKKCLT